MDHIYLAIEMLYPWIDHNKFKVLLETGTSIKSKNNFDLIDSTTSFFYVFTCDFSYSSPWGTLFLTTLGTL